MVWLLPELWKAIVLVGIATMFVASALFIARDIMAENSMKFQTKRSEKNEHKCAVSQL